MNLLQVKSGRNIKEIAKEYDINIKTVRSWMKLKYIRKQGKYQEQLK